MNWLIIAALVVVFVLQVLTLMKQESKPQAIQSPLLGERVDVEPPPEPPFQEYILHDWDIKGLFGHMWLHGGIIHLLGNVLFLWIFGNAVCAKIGNAVYLPIYLGFGLFAAVAHLIFAGGSVLGASGAIYGIVGMYLVFFVENDITCYFMWIFLLRPVGFTMSSYWMILFWLLFDIWGAIKGGGHVAYFAHLGGFAAGFALAVLMLKTGIVTMEKYERSLLQMWGKRKDKVQPESSTRYPGFVREMIDEGPTAATMDYEQQVKPVEPKLISLEPEKPKEDFIRFACSCGKRFKVPLGYAGRKARCPKCKGQIKIPEK